MHYNLGCVHLIFAFDEAISKWTQRTVQLSMPQLTFTGFFKIPPFPYVCSKRLSDLAETLKKVFCAEWFYTQPCNRVNILPWQLDSLHFQFHKINHWQMVLKLYSIKIHCHCTFYRVGNRNCHPLPTIATYVGGGDSSSSPPCIRANSWSKTNCKLLD